MAVRMFNIELDQPPTNFILHQLRLSRIRFNTHPLYRRWSMQAYDGRFAHVAEDLPEQVAQYLPITFISAPFVAGIIALLFGTETVKVVFQITAIILMVLIILVASAGPVLGAGLAALALVTERETGRWDLMMMIPRERIAVLMMRISTIQFPYRPLIATLDILQTLTAFILTLFLNLQLASSGGEGMMGTCFFFTIPALIMLTWERRQDYALSVALGAFAGLNRRESNALGWALGSSLAMVAVRGMLALLAVSLSPLPNGMGTLLPAFVAGPAVMPMLGIGLPVTLGLWLLYYGGRELLIIWLWRASIQRIEGWL